MMFVDFLFIYLFFVRRQRVLYLGAPQSIQYKYTERTLRETLKQNTPGVSYELKTTTISFMPSSSVVSYNAINLPGCFIIDLLAIFFIILLKRNEMK